MIIPYQSLSEAALQGVLEAFVLREGTDYGHRDFSLKDKTAAVLQALQSGRAQIHYDPDSGHLEILLTED